MRNLLTFANRALLSIVMVVGCQSQDGAISTKEAAFQDVFLVVDSIILQETDSVINVGLNVRSDAEGNYLIADEREKQLRIYSPSGQLLIHFGRGGSGPGEFEYPVALLRSRTGELIAVDGHGRLTTYTPDATRLVRNQATPFHTVYDADIVDDSTLLLSGVSSETPEMRLHLWDIKSNRLIRSFMKIPDIDPAAASAAGIANATVHGDTILALFALSDTIYRFTNSGKTLEAIALKNIGFRSLTVPPPARNAGLDAIKAWTASFSMMSQVYPLNEGFIVQYSDRENLIPNWRLAIVDRHGVATVVIKDSPKLLTQSARGTVFTHPTSLTPNKWAITEPLQ